MSQHYAIPVYAQHIDAITPAPTPGHILRGLEASQSGGRHGAPLIASSDSARRQCSRGYAVILRGPQHILAIPHPDTLVALEAARGGSSTY